MRAYFTITLFLMSLVLTSCGVDPNDLVGYWITKEERSASGGIGRGFRERDAYIYSFIHGRLFITHLAGGTKSLCPSGYPYILDGDDLILKSTAMCNVGDVHRVLHPYAYRYGIVKTEIEELSDHKLTLLSDMGEDSFPMRLYLIRIDGYHATALKQKYLRRSP